MTQAILTIGSKIEVSNVRGITTKKGSLQNNVFEVKGSFSCSFGEVYQAVNGNGRKADFMFQMADGKMGLSMRWLTPSNKSTGTYLNDTEFTIS